ncbi:MAG: GH3 auxin-responsive promoter family protein [Bacteroidales bacterium]|jgi:hypothetical protein|nr:GH3 auxin-responsive promoter family protein [Bacteroidales bacterium]
MPIIKSSVSWYIKRRISQIEEFMNNPCEVQLKLFHNLIDKAANTEWGRKYEYSSINTPEEYRQRVPVSNYEVFKHYIERLQKGEQNLLWPSKIRWFAKSSGTTANKSKFIPVSREAITDCHFKGGKDLLSIYYNNNPDAQLLGGKILGLSGSLLPVGKNGNDSFNGDISAVLLKNLPVWISKNRVPHQSLALLEDWELKIEKVSKAVINEDVRNITGAPSWMLLMMKKVLGISGKANLSEVWPRLELFIHGGMNFEPYRRQFENITPANMHYMDAYNASEGFFAVQDRPQYEDLLLFLDHGIYYEFVPLDELNNEYPGSLTLDEVQKDIVYALVISTNAGLWRYLIGDTVRFTEIAPYRIKIAGRTKNFINAVGEELMIDNAEKALSIACERTGAVLSEFTAAPVYFQENENAAHEWIIEFEKEPVNMKSFSQILDTELKKLNSDYEAKRYNNMILRKPVIHSAPEGTFYLWLKSKGKLGGQNKVPRLSNNRNILDEIANITNKRTES